MPVPQVYSRNYKGLKAVSIQATRQLHEITRRHEYISTVCTTCFPKVSEYDSFFTEALYCKYCVAAAKRTIFKISWATLK